MKPVTTLLDCGLLIQSEPGSSLSLRLDQTLDCGQCFTFSPDRNRHLPARHGTNLARLGKGSCAAHLPAAGRLSAAAPATGLPAVGGIFDLTTDYDAIPPHPFPRSYPLNTPSPLRPASVSFAKTLGGAVLLYHQSEQQHQAHQRNRPAALQLPLESRFLPAIAFPFPFPQRLAAATLRNWSHCAAAFVPNT